VVVVVIRSRPTVGGAAVQATVKLTWLMVPDETVVLAVVPPVTVQFEASPLSATL
jgi:hypothetical protein